MPSKDVFALRYRRFLRILSTLSRFGQNAVTCRLARRIGRHLSPIRLEIDSYIQGYEALFGLERNATWPIWHRFLEAQGVWGLHAFRYGKLDAQWLASGLFVGGDDPDLPKDNYELERWFRNPKSHERRIHGHRHAGVRIVQEGPTLLPTLDAHLRRREPFTSQELRPYADAKPPACQTNAIHRRTVMRKARSKKTRPLLLSDLEQRYLDYS